MVPYAELHCHSNFSFLDGASHPEELVEEAVRLGLQALALTDHDGFYGVVRMAEAAELADYRLATIFGAEMSLGLSQPQNGIPDPEGSHLLALARGEEGYHRLAGALTEAQLRGGEKGRPVYDLDDLAARAGGNWLVLTGCRKGTVRQALLREGADAAGRELDRLVGLFGQDNIAVELIDHGYPLDSGHNDALAELARVRRLPVVATNNVHFATPERRPLATALAAVRSRRSLDEIDGWLPAAGAAHLRSGAEMAARFARYPGAVARTVDYAEALAFSLRKAKPRLPRQDVPEGYTPMRWLRHLVRQGAERAYGTYTGRLREETYARLEKELRVIEEKDFPGYFLIVHDIVNFAKSRNILCQGRGSAANSAVCYVSASPRSTPSSTTSRSSASCPRPARRSPTSTSTSTPTAARRSSSTSMRSTAVTTPPRWPTSSATARRWRSATWRRRSATAPGSRTPGPSRSTRGGPRRPRRTPTFPGPSSRWPRSC